MGWWGKIIGGAFGYLVGGPLGGLLGIALGHGFDRGLEHARKGALPWPPLTHQEATQTAFFTATFSVMGHLAKSDGRVTRDELGVATDLMRQMHLNPEHIRVAQQLFNQGKAPDFPLDAVLDEFRRKCQGRRNLMRLFVEIQLYAALADGALHPRERRLILYVCRRLGLPDREFLELEAMIGAELRFRRTADPRREVSADKPNDLADAYALLNVAPNISDAELKRAYRRLISQHHPDKLVASGLPEEMMKLATAKTQEIKLAYERIKKARGL
ncbi:MAG: co-chaperone DjlA [Gammaproteobacteria bacterium]